jgi:hypothetical protein
MFDFSGVDRQLKIDAINQRIEYLESEILEKCQILDVDESIVKSGEYVSEMDDPLSFHEQLEAFSRNYVFCVNQLNSLVNS